MNAYYLVIDCEVCGNDVYHGPVISGLDEHRGLPVVPADLITQTRVVCDHCDAVHYFGDIDVMVEQDVDPIAEEDM